MPWLDDAALRSRIEVVVADITTLDLDAIVNAANQTLLGGGGVDGAIHRAAGPELLEACRALPEVRPNVRCPTGEARITPGFRLRARYVIHTVGPVWHGGTRDESRLLAQAYLSSMALASEHGLKSIGFPAISAGAYGYPPDAAASVAVREITAALLNATTVDKVLLVAFAENMAIPLRSALRQ